MDAILYLALLVELFVAVDLWLKPAEPVEVLDEPDQVDAIAPAPPAAAGHRWEPPLYDWS